MMRTFGRPSVAAAAMAAAAFLCGSAIDACVFEICPTPAVAAPTFSNAGCNNAAYNMIGSASFSLGVSDCNAGFAGFSTLLELWDGTLAMDIADTGWNPVSGRCGLCYDCNGIAYIGNPGLGSLGCDVLSGDVCNTFLHIKISGVDNVYTSADATCP